MSGSMVGKLIAKEIYMNRWIMAVATVAAMASIVASCFGPVAYGIGGITFLTTMIAYGVVLAMFSVAAERKEKTIVFVLSLPISRGEYLRAKVVGVLLAFLIPWAIVLVTALIAILVSSIPDGGIVQAVLLMGFLLMDYCVVVSVLMVARREGATVALIILSNMSVTFYMIGVNTFTSVGPNSGKDVVSWDTTALAILGCEVVVTAIVFVISSWVHGREPEIL